MARHVVLGQELLESLHGVASHSFSPSGAASSQTRAVRTLRSTG